MRKNATCRRCHHPVTLGVDKHGNQLILRSDPTALGYVHPTGDYVDGKPVMCVHGSPLEVPANEPLRYSIHLCDSMGGA